MLQSDARDELRAGSAAAMNVENVNGTVCGIDEIHLALIGREADPVARGAERERRSDAEARDADRVQDLSRGEIAQLEPEERRGSREGKRPAAVDRERPDIGLQRTDTPDDPVVPRPHDIEVAVGSSAEVCERTVEADNRVV